MVLTAVEGVFVVFRFVFFSVWFFTVCVLFVGDDVLYALSSTSGCSSDVSRTRSRGDIHEPGRL